MAKMQHSPFRPGPGGQVNEEGVMSFGDHLDELRARLIYALLVPLPLMILLFFVSDTLMDWLLLPLFSAQGAEGLPQRAQALSVPELLVTRLKLSIIAAIVLTIPWILWQLWLFIRPGLMEQERRFVRFLIPGSFVLTTAGIALLYFVMLPLMLQVLVAFGQSPPNSSDAEHYEQLVAQLVEPGEAIAVYLLPPDIDSVTEGDVWLLQPQNSIHFVASDESGALIVRELAMPLGSAIDQQYRVSWYINFVLLLMLGISIAFQMPLVLVVLGWVGLVTPQWLRSRRKHALLVCAVVSAMITPAEALSMIMMMVPLYALFELGILLMLLAPAKRVAEGTVLTPTRAAGAVSRTSDQAAADKPASRPRQQGETAQTESRAGSSKSTEQDQTEPPDGDGDRLS